MQQANVLNCYLSHLMSSPRCTSVIEEMVKQETECYSENSRNHFIELCAPIPITD